MWTNFGKIFCRRTISICSLDYSDFNFFLETCQFNKVYDESRDEGSYLVAIKEMELISFVQIIVNEPIGIPI